MEFRYRIGRPLRKPHHRTRLHGSNPTAPARAPVRSDSPAPPLRKPREQTTHAGPIGGNGNNGSRKPERPISRQRLIAATNNVQWRAGQRTRTAAGGNNRPSTMERTVTIERVAYRKSPRAMRPCREEKSRRRSMFGEFLCGAAAYAVRTRRQYRTAAGRIRARLRTRPPPC